MASGGSGVLSQDELALWRHCATDWRDGGETIPLDEVAAVGRIVLRLLDEIDRLKAAFVPRPMRPVAAVPALELEFHVLYHLTARLVSDLSRGGDVDGDELIDQLRRLRPTFDACTAACTEPSSEPSDTPRRGN